MEVKDEILAMNDENAMNKLMKKKTLQLDKIHTTDNLVSSKDTYAYIVLIKSIKYIHNEHMLQFSGISLFPCN